MNEKSTVIPRPVTKRQLSSPANCGVAHINLSDVVAKINSGPKSCTNPFLNGILNCSLSISEDDNSNSIAINESLIQYNNEQVHAHVVNVKCEKNPFSKRRHDDISFFSFPSNGNIDDSQPTNSHTEFTEKTDTLIELNEDEAPLSDSSTILGNINNAPCVQIHNRSLSDTSSTTLAPNIYEQSTTNPFTAGNLHKTVSDTYLEQYTTQKKLHTNSFNRTPSRQSMQHFCNEQTNNSPTSLNLNESEMKRAMSCESVNSESSVLLADLEQQTMPTVTGQLCVGLQYDK